MRNLPKRFKGITSSLTKKGTGGEEIGFLKKKNGRAGKITRIRGDPRTTGRGRSYAASLAKRAKMLGRGSRIVEDWSGKYLKEGIPKRCGVREGKGENKKIRPGLPGVIPGNPGLEKGHCSEWPGITKTASWQ